MALPAAAVVDQGQAVLAARMHREPRPQRRTHLLRGAADEKGRTRPAGRQVAGVADGGQRHRRELGRLRQVEQHAAGRKSCGVGDRAEQRRGVGVGNAAMDGEDLDTLHDLAT